MKKSKILCLLLAMCLFITTFVGCGIDSAEEDRDFNISGVNEFPVVDKKVEFTVFASKSSFVSDFETNEFTKWYEEKTGVHINWIVPSGDAQQSFNLMIASGEYPDAILGMGLSREQVSSLIAQDLLLDIKDEINEHGYYIKKMFEEMPSAEKYVTFDGGIYGVPKVSANYNSSFKNAMWVYQPWLDKLGLDAPTTTDEFYEMLVAFRDKDPNGNGKKDEIPFAARGVRNWGSGVEAFIMSAFIPTDHIRYYVEDGKVKYAPVQDEYREGLRYLKKLYDEGLLYADSFIIDRNQITAIGENDTPILGASTGSYQGFFCNSTGTTDRYHEFTSIAPLEGPNGVRATVPTRTCIEGTSFMVMSNCKYPDVAVKWVDWLLSAEGRHASQASTTSTYRKANEGELGLDGEQAEWAVEQISEGEVSSVSNKSWLNCTIWYAPREESLSIYNPSKTADAYYKVYSTYKPYASTKYPKIYINDEDVEAVADYAGIEDEVDMYFAKFVTGKLDLDKDWDTYIQGLNSLGLEEYIAILQRGYDKDNYVLEYDGKN